MPFGTFLTIPKTCTVNTRTKTESTYYLRHTLYRTDTICPVDDRKIYINKNAKRTQIALRTSGILPFGKTAPTTKSTNEFPITWSLRIPRDVHIYGQQIFGTVT